MNLELAKTFYKQAEKQVTFRKTIMEELLFSIAASNIAIAEALQPKTVELRPVELKQTIVRNTDMCWCCEEDKVASGLDMCDYCNSNCR